MKQPTFNFVQSVFTLNMFANLVSDKKASQDTLSQDLSAMLYQLFANEFVQQKIGTWQVVWGPIVGSYGSDKKREYASNALYVAVNEDDQYVVATSATDPASYYGWFVEDFDVHTMVQWPGSEGVIPAPMIANGTHTGLDHLLKMKWKDTTLLEFLTNTFSSSTTNTELVVTGHSLGGAQSTVLALYLYEMQTQWNPAGTIMVCAEPTAGASPGNKAFSDYHNAVMGSRTQRFWNALDPVPHGWAPDMVEMMPFLYYPYLKPQALFKSIVALVLAQSLEGTSGHPKGGFYTQVMPQTPPLPGQVDLTQTADLSGTQVLEILADLALDEILAIAKLKIPATEHTIIIDAINAFINQYAGENTIDMLMQDLENYLKEKLSNYPELLKLLAVIWALLLELENVLLFVLQLVSQHVTAYPYLMGTASMHPLSESIINTMVNAGIIDTDYKNVVTRLQDPKRALKKLPSFIGDALVALVTDEFIDKCELPAKTV